MINENTKRFTERIPHPTTRQPKSGILDKNLETKILATLTTLERELVDCVGNTEVRHTLSALLVEMRWTLWECDDAAYYGE